MRLLWLGGPSRVTKMSGSLQVVLVEVAVEVVVEATAALLPRDLLTLCSVRLSLHTTKHLRNRLTWIR